jgi:hypothetical protein
VNSCSLSDEVVSRLDYTAPNGRIIGEYKIGKDLEGSGRDLIEV